MFRWSSWEALLRVIFVAPADLLIVGNVTPSSLKTYIERLGIDYRRRNQIYDSQPTRNSPIVGRSTTGLPAFDVKRQAGRQGG